MSAYSEMRQEICLRIGQQNKCVELSIVFTAGAVGLAAALFGAGKISVSDLPLHGSFKEGHYLAAGCLFVYVSVQQALLMNYIYQTWLLLGINAYIALSAGKSDGEDFALEPGVWERNFSQMISAPVGKWCGRLISIFQPLMIYIWAGLGTFMLLVFEYNAFHAPGPSKGGNVLLVILSGWSIAVTVLLGFLHLKVATASAERYRKATLTTVATGKSGRNRNV